IQHSRDELIKVFKSAANLLREDGLQAGLDRFGAFSDILFLSKYQSRGSYTSSAEIPLRFESRTFFSSLLNADLNELIFLITKSLLASASTSFSF
ncbi:MAG: hypothetical protein ACEY3E_01875, partial [Candidatus Tisiphia sp.]